MIKSGEKTALVFGIGKFIYYTDFANIHRKFTLFA